VKEVGENGLAPVMGRANGPRGGRWSDRLRCGRGFGLGGAKLVFFLRKWRVWLGVDSLLLPAAKPSGFIDLCWGQFRCGFVLGGASATVRDEAFDGHDDRDGLDLTCDAVTGHFGAQFGEFPEAVQDLFAALFLAVQPLRSSTGQVGFLIGDGVTDIIFGHRWLLGVMRKNIGTRVFERLGKSLWPGRGLPGVGFLRISWRKQGSMVGMDKKSRRSGMPGIA
jgi:hypothetical protein